jgi:hypothetical protein
MSLGEICMKANVELQTKVKGSDGDATTLAGA